MTEARLPKREKRLYAFCILLLTLTGFGQMPIFKRYYIADIPGFAWLAQFYVTHILHYLTAAIWMGLLAYLVIPFIARGLGHLTVKDWIRTGVVSGLVVSGIFMVIRNLSGVMLPHTLIIAVNILHLSLVMTLAGLGIHGLLNRKHAR